MPCCIVRGTPDAADVGGGWGSGNLLHADGAAVVAGALSKLVNLTSLDLQCTWHVECVHVVCCCVCVLSCAVFVVVHGMRLMLAVYVTR
mgnify:CR=1 FL=1